MTLGKSVSSHFISVINLKFYVILHHCFSVLKVLDKFLELISFEIVVFYDFVHLNQDECCCESSKHTSSQVLHVLIKTLLQIK